MGHLPQVCKSTPLNRMEGDRHSDSPEDHNLKDDDENSAYNINIFRINTTKRVLPEYITKRKDFKSHVMVNNRLAKVTSDTGAKVSVCGTKQAKEWDLLSRMVPSKMTLKPYQSTPNSSSWGSKVFCDIRIYFDPRSLAHNIRVM